MSDQIEYREYIASQEWRRRRRAFLGTHPYCNRCGMSMESHKELFGTALHVHHISYARLGNELDSDLETLCKRCHETEEHYETEYQSSDISLEGDYLSVSIKEKIRSGRYAHGIEYPVFDLPSREYWPVALAIVDAAKRKLVGVESAESWDELERLNVWEIFVRNCLEDARSNAQ